MRDAGKVGSKGSVNEGGWVDEGAEHQKVGGGAGHWSNGGVSRATLPYPIDSKQRSNDVLPRQHGFSIAGSASASPAAAAPAAPEAEAEAEAGEAEESGGSELDSESVPESGFWTREAVGAADGEGGGRGRLGEEPTGEAELDGAGEAAELLLKGEGDGGLNEGEGEAEALACRAGELSGVEKAESDGEKMEKEEEEEKELQEESAGDA
ncbi:unnamed protein product [Closterium sp. NIES-53]